MKYLPVISVIIVAIVIINELAYIEKTSLALVIIGLAIAVGLNSVFLLNRDKK